MKPFVFMDINGVLDPFLAKAEDIEDYEVVYSDWDNFRILKSHKVWLDELATTAQLVWASSWMDDSNNLISPVLGIGRLPYVDLSSSESGLSNFKLTGVLNFLKLNSVDKTKVNTPFVWFDDDFYDEDEIWLKDKIKAPFKLIKTDPRIGWTEQQKNDAIQFLSEL